MDKLTALIVETERDIRRMYENIESIEREIDQKKLRLDVLKEADRLRPPIDDEDGVYPDAGQSLPSEGMPSTDSAHKRKGGRQPGSISMDWRKTLIGMDDHARLFNQGLGFDGIYQLAKSHGVKGGEHSVRDRIRKYCDRLKLLERDGDTFRVRPEIAGHYRVDLGLPEPPDGPGLFGDAPATPREEIVDATM